MMLRATGILGAFLISAAESGAFVAFPPRLSSSCTPNKTTSRPLVLAPESARQKVLVAARSQRLRLGTADEGWDSAVPRLVVMDLDDTLWRAEIEQMKGSPFTRGKDGKVVDCGGKVIDLFPGFREALLEVHRGERFAGTRLAIASRTPAIRWARDVLSLLELEPGLPMDSVFSYSEIYSGSKIGHFGELQRNTGVAYADMIFFDDWDKNCKEVGSLGVTCVECQRGLNQGVWARGLAGYAAAKKNL